MTYKLPESVTIKYFGLDLGYFCHHIFHDLYSLYKTLLILALSHV